MISRRDKLLNYPFQVQRFQQHKERVRSAKSVIDMRSPIKYTHVQSKPKKAQKERERLQRIESENIRLLQKLNSIMESKRMENFWKRPRPNFLQRETLFNAPLKSASLPRHAYVYAPNTVDTKSIRPILKSPNSKIARRCPTCIGKPIRNYVEIPEERSPWLRPHKSWNVKASTEVLPKICMHCGHPKPFQTQ